MYNQPNRPQGSQRSSYGNSGGGYRSQNTNSYGGGYRAPQRFGKRRFSGQYIDVNKFINKIDETIVVEDYKPTNHFADLKINPTLKANILGKGYTMPTAIQDQAIPAGLAGNDLIGMANTGTGKTAAFLIPLINKISLHPHQRVLIMTPTRELAEQIMQEFKDFAIGMNQYATLCIGGASIGQQISQLRRNPQFVIGTPGRLKDLVTRRILPLAGFQSVVLDEADRMLDMGFIDDIQELLAMLPEKRQTLFFSATLSPRIRTLTTQFLQNPVMISVKTRDTAATVDQDVIRYGHDDQKLDQLHDLLVKEDFQKVLVFAKTKQSVEDLSNELADRGFGVTSIHGNKNQSQRQRALKMFKQDVVQVLIATDVAARGLDIPNVSHVINFDVPSTYEDYVHRIGRTGRANKKGYALTFVNQAH